MGDLFLVRFGGDDDDRRAREEREAAERERLRNRYALRLTESADVDQDTARRVMTALFEPADRGGRRCRCSCHPHLSTQHDDGFDCRCTWDEARVERARAEWNAWYDSPAAAELNAAHLAEEAEITTWLAGMRDVQAKRTTSYAPEQWTGSIDGHSFYFRERHGLWRIELDLEPTGRFAERLVGVDDDGEPMTEPSPIREGEVVAEGTDSQLGESPVEHLAHIVGVIREHLWRVQCDHAGALFYCPKCGMQMSG